MFEGKELCYETSGSIKSVNTSKVDDYVCFSCNCEGSFIVINSLNFGYLKITEIRARGTKKKEAGKEEEKKHKLI